MSLRQRLNMFKVQLAETAQNLDDPVARRRAWLHFMVFDHGILRTFWTNFFQISPGVFRSNQPSPSRLKAFADRGIKTIVNLRGITDAPHYQFETTACAEHDLTLIDLPGFSARAAPPRYVLLALLEVLRSAERPLVLHCKSGADRTSLAAAIHLLANQGASVAQARRQFAWWYVHFKWTSTGVLDRVLDAYEAAQRTTGIEFEDWLHTAYDPDAITYGFETRRG